MLNIVQSNRMDALADAMLAHWNQRDDPFAVDVIIVPSRAVERWLTYQIADRFGVCANVEFSFGAAFIWQMFSRVLLDVSEQSPFDTDVTTLRLFSYLAKLPSKPELRPLASYLAGGDVVRRLELARRVAQLFSQYMIYRPDWLAQWAANVPVKLALAEPERWQRHLWRWLLESLGAHNVQHPMDEFFSALESKRVDAATFLPGRLRVFGLPGVPPLYAEVLARLSRHIEVDWYSINPCRQYWVDITREKDRARRMVRGESVGAYDVGQPLLASWGGQAQAQLALVSGFLGEEGSVDEDFFVEPVVTSLLHRVQGSILDLTEPAPGSLGLESGDGSIQVHACHSLTRQVEVLHDQLLALFDAMPGLRASDIAVFTPNIDSAAPVIEAVFGAMPRSRHIPYAITGRARPDSSPLLRAADFLLQLPGSRFEASLVLAFLEIPAVARRYELDASDSELIQQWLRETGVHWGLDAEHRRKLGLPAQSRHTWQETLYKLLLGYALPGGTDCLVFGLLPYGELEGSQALTLGKLIKVLSDLVRASQMLGEQRRLQDWPAVLLRLFDNSIQADTDDERDHARLLDALAGLGRDARMAGVQEEVGIDVVRTLILSRLTQSAPGAVPTGQVTFAGLGPLRAVPYKVICLIGLDDGVIPRNRARLEFDLMQSSPRLGDRSSREDDRGAFLDSILAAGDVLYLSYTGRDIRDNARLPPSVLVAELLDYLGRWTTGGRKAVDAALFTDHPLQPFSLRYFGGGRLFSYASDLLPVARALGTDPGLRLTARAPLDGTPLSPPDESARNIDLDQLVRFFTHPVSYLLSTRLGIRLSETAEEISSDEPFELDLGGNFSFKEQLLEWRLQSRSIEECRGLALASPLSPVGAWGRQALEPILEDVDAFAARVAANRPDSPRDPAPFEISLAEFTLIGTLSGLYKDGLFSYALHNEGVHGLLPAWIRHLALCCAKPDGVAQRTSVLTRDGGFQFDRVKDAAKTLGHLLELYWRGIQGPLSFYPKSSYALVTTLFDGKDEDKAMQAARSCWEGGYKFKGECESRWYQVGYGNAPRDFPDDFVDVAHGVLDAPLAARRDLVDAAVGATA